MKKNETFGFHSELTSLQSIWIDYFTRQFSIKKVKNEKSDKIFQILSNLSYKPTDLNTLKNQLQICKSQESITDELIKIFNFQVNDVVTAIELSNFVLTSTDKISKSPNFSLVVDSIFRGFIELSAFLKPALEYELNRQAGRQIFAQYDWKSMHTIIDFLIIYSKSNIHQFIECLNPIHTIYLTYAEKLFQLHDQEYIQTNFQKFLWSMLSLSSASPKIIDFLTEIVRMWLSQTIKYDFQDQFFLISNFYIQKIISLATTLSDSQRTRVISVTQLYLSHFRSHETDKNLFSQGFECLSLFSDLISSYDSLSNSLEGIFSFLYYSMSIFFQTENLLKPNHPPTSIDQSQLVFQSTNDYFKNTKIFKKNSTQYTFVNNNLKKVSTVFASLLNNEAFCQEILKEFFQYTKNIETNDRNQLLLLLIVSIFDVTNLSEFLLSFLFEIFYGRFVLVNPSNELHQLLLDNIFLFAFKRITLDNKLYSAILLPLINSNDFQFEQILIYIPLFTSLLRQNIALNTKYFINFFLSLDNLFDILSTYFGNRKYQPQIDALITFIHILVQNYPKDVFGSNKLNTLIFRIVTYKRFMEMMIPCIQLGLRIKNSNDTTLLQIIIHNITNTFDELLNTKDPINENTKELASKYLTIIINSLDFFTEKEILSIAGQHFLMSIASIVQRTKDANMMNDVIMILFSIDRKSNNRIPQFGDYNSALFSSLKESFKCVNLTELQIGILLDFAMDEKVDYDFKNKIPTIQNATILKFLIDITRNTSFEEDILDKLILLCKGSASNSFECFHIDIINYSLELMHNEQYRLKALDLYQIISSLYFSPLSLYETFNSLYTTTITKTTNFHQMILHCFLSLIIEKRPNPVNRFFHLNGRFTGIKCTNITEYFDQNWLFIATLRFDTSRNSFHPLISLTDQNDATILFTFFKDKLYFKRSMSSLAIAADLNSEFCFSEVSDSESSQSSSSIFSLKKKPDAKLFTAIFDNASFEKNTWYQILISYTPKSIQLYINGKQQPPIELPRGFSMSGNVSLTIGSFAPNYFSGDLGPILFMGSNAKSHSEYIEQIIKEYPDSFSYNQFLSIMAFDPVNCSGNEILDVTPKGLSAELIGKAVTFSETLYNVLQYAGTFERFLPLFTICNDLQIDEPIETNSEAVDNQIFHILLVILKLFLEISIEMEKSFESIGGFQLLVGLFDLLDPKSISVYVPLDLTDIYKSLKTDSLKNQMVEYIWLNFSFWSSLTYNVQMTFYTNALREAYLHDKKPFQLKQYDFLLFEIESKVYLKNDVIDNDVPSSQINQFISESEMEEIIALQWNFYSDIFTPNKGTICYLYMILSFSEQIACRKHAWALFIGLLALFDSEMLQVIKLWDRIDYFLDSIAQFPEQALHCIYHIGKLMKNGQLSFTEFNLNLGLFAISLILKRNDYNIPNIDHFFNDCQDFVFYFYPPEESKISFNIIDFLPIMSFLTLYTSQTNINSAYSKLHLSLSNDFQSFETFINNNPCWPFFVFVLSNNSGDLYSLFSEIIQKSSILITQIINFIDFVQLTLKYDMFPYLSLLFVSLLQPMRIDPKLLYSCIFKSIFFTFPVDNLKKFEKLNKDEIYELFDNLENLDQFCKTNQKEYHPRFNENLFKLLSITLISNNSIFPVKLCQDLEFDTFFLYSYVISSLIIHTHSYQLFKDYETIELELKYIPKFTNTEYSRCLICHAYQQVKDLDDCNIDFTVQGDVTAAYDFILHILINLKTESIEQMHPISKFIKEAIEFGNSYDCQINKPFWMAYKETVKRKQQSRLIVENYNVKLAQSFIQECESNGGPLSKGPPKQVKWKWSNRIDYLFRPTIYDVNLSFDDHLKASRTRDSESLDDIDKQEQVIPFKRILDQSVSLVDSHSQKQTTSMLTIASFEVVNLRINIRYKGNLNVLSNTISFEGRGLCDGLGTPFPAHEQRLYTKYIKIPFDSIEFIFIRSHMYEDNACEIYTELNKSYFFIFDSTNNRNEFLSIIKKEIDSKSAKDLVKHALARTITQNQCVFNSNGDFDFFASLRKVTNCHIQTMPSSEMLSKSGITEAWKNRYITNFMYLFLLNILAQRSMNDLSKYPVFPWILCDYSSESIDLKDPNVYRKLDTPLGAYNENRLRDIKNQSMNCFDKMEYCMYRTHYSSAASVIGYLIRTEPFTSLHITLQDGKFDHPNRLFFSIERSWVSVTAETSDFRELIPQFFCDPHFLMNENGFDLGKTMNGYDVSNVALPKWANNSAYRFIEIQRMALESEYVSMNLQHWIDLIFGVYQRSEEKNNLYHMFSYPDCIHSPLLKDAYTIQIAKYHGMNFGICCDQIFTQIHPNRKELTSPICKSLSGLQDISIQNISYYDNDCMILNDGDLLFFDGNQISKVLQMKLKELRFYSQIRICKYFKMIFLIPRSGTFMNVVEYKTDGSPANEIKRLSNLGSSISCLEIVDNRWILTGGNDCTICILSLPSLQLVARLSIQSKPVISMSCCEYLDIIASIDGNHQVWCYSLRRHKLIHTFQVACPSNSKHQILAIQNGFIAISSTTSYSISNKFEPNNSLNNQSSDSYETERNCIDIFDIQGNFIQTIKLESPVVKMRYINLLDLDSYIIASLENMSLIAIRLSSFEKIKLVNDHVLPNYYSIDDLHKEIHYVSVENGENILKTCKIK